MCGVFGMSKVKVPVIFSSTEGFPPRRDGRYVISIWNVSGLQGSASWATAHPPELC